MKAALAYLERYAASAEMLRRVLGRRVDRAVRAGVAEREPGMEAVAAVVARCRSAQLVDDRVFAQGRAETLLRQGKAPRAIADALSLAGIDRTLIEAVLERLRDEHGDPAFHAALRLARRRRLGPFRAGDRVPHRERDMAAMGRAGHSYDLARRIIDGELEALEEEDAA